MAARLRANDSSFLQPAPEAGGVQACWPPPAAVVSVQHSYRKTQLLAAHPTLDTQHPYRHPGTTMHLSPTWASTLKEPRSSSSEYSFKTQVEKQNIWCRCGTARAEWQRRLLQFDESTISTDCFNKH